MQQIWANELREIDIFVCHTIQSKVFLNGSVTKYFPQHLTKHFGMRIFSNCGYWKRKVWPFQEKKEENLRDKTSGPHSKRTNQTFKWSEWAQGFLLKWFTALLSRFTRACLPFLKVLSCPRGLEMVHVERWQGGSPSIQTWNLSDLSALESNWKVFFWLEIQKRIKSKERPWRGNSSNAHARMGSYARPWSQISLGVSAGVLNSASGQRQLVAEKRPVVLRCSIFYFVRYYSPLLIKLPLGHKLKLALWECRLAVECTLWLKRVPTRLLRCMISNFWPTP